VTQQEQPPPSIIVTVVQEPVREQTVADVIIGALGVAGVLVVLALLLSLVVGLVLVVWNRWFRPEADHLPSITSTPAEASLPPSSQSR
jgi:ABC-type dipeptide/oligopeptide/nickel transport system permease component